MFIWLPYGHFDMMTNYGIPNPHAKTPENTACFPLHQVSRVKHDPLWLISFLWERLNGIFLGLNLWSWMQHHHFKVLKSLSQDAWSWHSRVNWPVGSHIFHFSSSLGGVFPCIPIGWRIFKGAKPPMSHHCCRLISPFVVSYARYITLTHTHIYIYRECAYP